METDTIIKKRGKGGSNVILPPDEWTLRQAHALNPQVCHASVYHRVKNLVKLNEVIVCGEIKISGKGKPSMLYRIATEVDQERIKDEQTKKESQKFSAEMPF